MDEKIIGSPLVTPMKVSDYNQNNSKRSDYIKNRPFYDLTEIVCDLKNVLPSDNKKQPYDNYVPQMGDTLICTTEYDGEIDSKEVTISEFSTLINTKFGICKLYSDGFSITTTEGDGISICITKKGELKQLDEKFIPDTIARKSDIEGGGSAVQSDYNQNDSTQPDYIKNRPFYTEMISVEADLSNVPIDFDSQCASVPVDGNEVTKLLDYVEEWIPVIIEIHHNGNVFKKDALVHKDGYFVNDGVEVAFDGGNIYFVGFWGSYLSVLTTAESFDGVSIKIYRESAKKMDKKFLPPNDVPYIYSENGSVRLHDLDTGVYVLHGIFELGGQNEGCWFEEFSEYPTLCQLKNYKEETFIKLSWVYIGNSETDDGLVGRYVEVEYGEVITDFRYSLFDAQSLAVEAMDMASEAVTYVEDAYGMANDAMAAAEEALYASEAGVEARDSIIMLSNGDYPLPAIVLNDENGDAWFLTLDENGVLCASGGADGKSYKLVRDEDIGDIDTALDAILALDEELMTPNGDEVEY